jgi:isoquinoline 1-oxidoreductase
MMGLGPALREEVLFQNGRLTNGEFAAYRVPRFEDLPKLDVILLDRKDLEPAGAGETPVIAIAPAIANAVFDATGKRVHSMPMAAARG